MVSHYRDDRILHTSFRSLLHAVAEREERIRPHHRSLRIVTGEPSLVDRQESGVDARHLASADTNRCSISREDDRV